MLDYPDECSHGDDVGDDHDTQRGRSPCRKRAVVDDDELLQGIKFVADDLHFAARRLKLSHVHALVLFHGEAPGLTRYLTGQGD